MPSALEQLNNSFSRFGVRPEKVKEKKIMKQQLHEMLSTLLKSENSYVVTSSITDNSFTY